MCYVYIFPSVRPSDRVHLCFTKLQLKAVCTHNYCISRDKQVIRVLRLVVMARLAILERLLGFGQGLTCVCGLTLRLQFGFFAEAGPQQVFVSELVSPVSPIIFTYLA